MKTELKKGTIVTTFKIKSDSEEVLKHAVQIAMLHRSRGLEHYKVDGDAIIFYWHHSPSDNTIKLPYTLKADNAFGFINEWLKSIPEENRETENEDYDGSHGPGFIITKTDKFDYEEFRVQAINIHYGK